MVTEVCTTKAELIFRVKLNVLVSRVSRGREVLKVIGCKTREKLVNSNYKIDHIMPSYLYN